MPHTITIGTLRVDRQLADFIANEVAPGTGIDCAEFWVGYEKLLDDLTPENKRLLAERDAFQARIDGWNNARAGRPFDVAEQRKFLEEIGYIVPDGGDFRIETMDVDVEIATIAGPQLVVPVMNARFALDAANARWGSLYDALYCQSAPD